MINKSGGNYTMGEMIIPITKGARKFGYVIWTSRLNKQVDTFLNATSQVHLYFMGADLGEKRVDWKYHRISIGYRWTRRLPMKVSKYILTFTKRGNELVVECQ